ncbi:MAG: hypothetical protein VW270_23570, partial [Candidatus Poseidoniales archaeon]
SGVSTRSGVQVFSGNTIHNDTIFANGGLVIASSVSSGGSNIIGKNGNLNANNAIASGAITVPMLQETPIANTTARTLISDRMQVANTTTLVNDRMQVANTTTLVNDRLQVANGVLKTSQVEQVMSANLVVDAGADSSTSGVHISNGQIGIFTETGVPALVDFYCEVSNAHKVRLQAPAHGDFGGDVAVTLPIKSGNVALTNSETFVGTTATENLNVADTFRILTKSSDPSTSNAANEGISAGSILYSNTHLYVGTDASTVQKVRLYKGPEPIHASITITASGASAYLFNGAGTANTNNETLYLYKGFTYEFVNTTGANHPFQILNSAGGTAFANGVSGSQSGTQLFTVPHAQQSNLVYQCSIHSGMQGVLVIVS